MNGFPVPCAALCCLLLPETTPTGPLWEEQTEVSGTRGGGVYSAASLIIDGIFVTPVL